MNKGKIVKVRHLTDSTWFSPRAYCGASGGKLVPTGANAEGFPLVTCKRCRAKLFLGPLPEKDPIP